MGGDRLFSFLCSNTIVLELVLVPSLVSELAPERLYMRAPFLSSQCLSAFASFGEATDRRNSASSTSATSDPDAFLRLRQLAIS
jgi:hypothetical protein